MKLHEVPSVEGSLIKISDDGFVSFSVVESPHSPPRNKPLQNRYLLTIQNTEDMIHSFFHYTSMMAGINSVQEKFPKWLFTSGELKKLTRISEKKKALLLTLIDEFDISKEDLRAGNYDNNNMVKKYYSLCDEHADYCGELEARLGERLPKNDQAYQLSLHGKLKVKIFICLTREYASSGEVSFEYTEEEILNTAYFYDQRDLLGDAFEEVMSYVLVEMSQLVKKSQESLALLATAIKQLVPGAEGETKRQSSNSPTTKKSSQSPASTRRRLRKLKKK